MSRINWRTMVKPGHFPCSDTLGLLIRCISMFSDPSRHMPDMIAYHQCWLLLNRGARSIVLLAADGVDEAPRSIFQVYKNLICTNRSSICNGHNLSVNTVRQWRLASQEWLTPISIRTIVRCPIGPIVYIGQPTDELIIWEQGSQRVPLNAHWWKWTRKWNKVYRHQHGYHESCQQNFLHVWRTMTMSFGCHPSGY